MKNLYWKLCVFGVVLFSILSFSPLIIPSNNFKPMISGIPRTLWAGMLVYIAIVFLTYIGTRVYPDNDDEKGGIE